MMVMIYEDNNNHEYYNTGIDDICDEGFSRPTQHNNKISLTLLRRYYDRLPLQVRHRVQFFTIQFSLSDKIVFGLNQDCRTGDEEFWCKHKPQKQLKHLQRA